MINEAISQRRIAGWVLAAGLGALCAAALPVAAMATDVTPFTVTVPTVTGPIPSTPTNFPFIALGFDVEPPLPAGYVEDEFFVSGTGNLYQYTPTGIEIVTPCPALAARGCTNLPYTTRMLVRRPADPARFSGTVVIEALNPSANFDIAGVWDRSREYFVRNGDIFVGWSSKSIIVDQTLKGFNPTRYAGLNWPYIPSPDGNINDGVYDGITFDIAAQIGALFKLNGPTSPIHDYHVRHVFESGFSQDGTFTFTQADIFHALERLPGDRGIYDGYVPMGTNGPANLDFGLTAAGQLPTGDPRIQMQPREVPVIQADTETEIFLGTVLPGGLAFERPDSDAIGDRYRLWEVPGGSHVSNDLNDPVITLQLNFAELEHLTTAELPPNGCTHQQFIDGPTVGIAGVVDPNNFPFAYVENAAFADLTEWVDFGLPPPHAPFITVNTSTTPPQIVRDQFGNAEGGVRTPFVDVPITTYVPFDTASHTTLLSGFCILDGYNIPFSDTQLDQLYRNHGTYVSRFAQETATLVRERFWLIPDAVTAVTGAAQSNVP
jgi:Alpha/beta hydrolase domain